MSGDIKTFGASAPRRFTAGDRVRVIAGKERGEDAIVGKIGIVKDHTLKVRVQFDDVEYLLSFFQEELELVAAESTDPVPRDVRRVGPQDEKFNQLGDRG